MSRADRSSRRVQAVVAVAVLALHGATALADHDESPGPPPFTFNDRCVPYEITDEFMRANGVDPDKILSTFVEGTPRVETFEVSNSTVHKIAAAVAV